MKALLALTLLTAALGCMAKGQTIGPPGGAIEHIGPFGGSRNMPDGPPLEAPALTAAQKAAIFSAVMRDRYKSIVSENLDVTVGEAVPTVDVHQLPADALAQAPTARSYSYTVLADRVVLVDPMTMRALDVIKP
jgi:hypothetical protein